MNKRLEKIIREVFNIKDETIEWWWTSDNVSNWDSMGHLNLIMAIEKEFDIKFEIEEMFQIRSLGDLDGILKNKVVVE